MPPQEPSKWCVCRFSFILNAHACTSLGLLLSQRKPPAAVRGAQGAAGGSKGAVLPARRVGSLLRQLPPQQLAASATGSLANTHQSPSLFPRRRQREVVEAVLAYFAVKHLAQVPREEKGHPKILLWGIGEDAGADSPCIGSTESSLCTHAQSGRGKEEVFP